MAPELETERLRLRYWREDDWHPLVAFFAEPKEINIMGGVDDPGFAWRVAACHVGHWQWRGYGMWALETKTDGALVGFCGAWYPADWPELELGWSLFAEHRRQGYATEAATTARSYIYSGLGHKSVVSYIDPNNKPSIAVAERLGCELEGEISLRPNSVALAYRHPPATEVLP